MIIEDIPANPTTTFEQLDGGETFFNYKNRDSRVLLMKCRGPSTSRNNAINLQNGNIFPFELNGQVIRVNAKVVIS
ncbi:MAG: hypothetical protein ACRDC4_00790 [Plesiomonas sp.]